MPVSETYGEALGKRLSADATAFQARALPKSTIAATELRHRNPPFTQSRPPAEEDAYLVTVFFEAHENYECWEEGRPAPITTIRPGETIIDDIRRRPVFFMNCPFHSMSFYLPIATLHALADEAETGRVDELHYRPAVGHADPVLRGMAESLLPAFSHPERASKPFMDHAMLAVGHHIACAYGGMQPFRRAVRGGLTPLQERRAKEFISGNLAGDLSLAEIANECRLSVSQFSRAFRQSVGMPAHSWMVQQRVAKAKSLLHRDEMTLAEIALACGFADQSHFTSSFSARTGISPGAWRRARQT